MLNEIIELEAYMGDPRMDKPRLQPNLLTDNFGKKNKEYKLNGLDQILTVIARGFIFAELEDELKTGKRVITDEEISTVKDALNRWCGFKVEMVGDTKKVDEWFNKYPKANDYLKNFWEYHHKKTSDKNLTWEECEKKWSDKYNSRNSYQAESVTFDNIIASALNAGPLKERLCIIKKPDEDALLKKIIKKPDALYDYLFTEYDGNPQKKTKIRMLRNIITFLMLRSEEGENKKEVLLPKLRLFGWYGTDDTDGKIYKWYLEAFKYNDEKIMYALSGADYTKFGIREDYLKKFGFAIIDANDKNKYIKDYLILKDPGYGDEPFEVL